MKSNRRSITIIPAAAFFLLLILGPIQFFPQIWNNTQGVPAYKLPRVIRSTRTGLCLLLFLTEGFFACVAVCTALLSPIPAFVSYLFIGLTAAIIVFILVQTYRK